MSKDTEAKNTVVSDKVQANRERINAVRERINAARVVMSEAVAKKNQSVTDAERVYSESYNAGLKDRNQALRDLDEAYALTRGEITERFDNELASLQEARDIAVTSANGEFDETKSAAQLTFGEG